MPLRIKSRVLVLAVILGLSLASCARNYVTKVHQLHLISEKTEIAIGAKAKQEIVKEYGTVNDIDWQVYIDEVGQRLAKASDRPNLPYDFTIVDSNEINAFAIPGGFIFVTKGILYELADEAELSIVLGHEITHVAAWHGIEQLQRAGLLSTLTALGAIGGAVAGAGQASIAIAQAASIYENMYLLGYGRKNESQADHYGILYAARAGYDPEAALTFFKRLDGIEKEEEAGQHISPYWRTHPPTQERLKTAAAWITQVEAMNKNNPPLNYNRDKYLEMVAKLPHGSDAERGEVKGNVYTNIPFGIHLEAPPGWTMDNARSQSLVALTGPVPGVKGTLVRVSLSGEMGVQEFGKQIAKQWGLQEATSRDVDYPAGHGLLWQYGGDYIRYRTLVLVRNGGGYTLTCEVPSETYLQYLVDCEQLMRSLQIQ